jgi:carbon storage regulator
MLILSRREGERLLIGGDVIVTIKKVRGKRVQVGIEAPDHVHVLREELTTWIDAPEDRTHVAEVPSEPVE